MIAVILSVLFPGLGQIYLGKNFRGVAMLLIGITPLYPLALVWSVIDVINLRNQGVEPVFSKKEAVWVIIFLLVIIPACFALLIYGGSFVVQAVEEHNKQKIILSDGVEIVRAIEKYKGESGKLPENLEVIISGNPLRYSWRTDSWGNPYIYEIMPDKNTYRLISKGRDGTRGTPDDIILH